MEHLPQVTHQIRNRVWLLTTLLQLAAAGLSYESYTTGLLSLQMAFILFAVLSCLNAWGSSLIASYFATIPLRAFGNAILHLSPTETPTAAPQTDTLMIGHQYVTSMVYQLNQLADVQNNALLAEHRREATQASNILTRLPLPLFVFSKEQIVTFASDSAISFTRKQSAELFGKPIFEAIDLEFPSTFTLESWIEDCSKNKATDTAYWRRVRVTFRDNPEEYRQCDMAGYYNRDNPTGIEFIVTLFDRTEEYSQDDQSLSFIALAVHEIRTPLTLMRGLIEVFQEDLHDNLDPGMTVYMERLRGSADALTSYVNTILNVARIEENQLAIKLAEENIVEVIQHAGSDMALRAKTSEKHITYALDKNLPTVAADRVTVYEVICNLLDNAIKYSGKSKDILLKASLTKDNLVEISVVDKGVGIPTSVLPTLFEKFHRNHRNQDSISGTGLGLYLSKVIVNAHGGDIWVKSKENEGTTVAFTLKPYSQLADELKTGNNSEDMVRTAHGWIKNHSIYRR